MTEYNMDVRPITLADYRHFFKEEPKRTIRGYSLVLNGKMIAVIGVLLGKKTTMMFSDVCEGFDYPPVLVWRWARRALNLMGDMRQPILTVTDGSGRFLEILGFCFRGNTDCGKLYEYMG